MADYNREIRVTRVTELITALKEFRGDYRWHYRGHSNIDWALIPKAARSPEMLLNEGMYFEAWKRRAIEFVDSKPEDDWDWLSIAQHYGFPTRLLDWSSNLLVAAFFSSNEEPETDAAVYAFRPRWIVDRNAIRPLDFDHGVASFRPSALTTRISRQHSGFTIHGPADQEITNCDDIGELWRIVIPFQNKTEMLRDLDQLGINAGSLFPDLDGMSRYLFWIISQRDLRAQILNEVDEQPDGE